jgi:hypothetical protein
MAIGISLAVIVMCTLAAMDPSYRLTSMIVSLPFWVVLIWGVRFIHRMGRVYQDPGAGFAVLPRQEKQS